MAFRWLLTGVIVLLALWMVCSRFLFSGGVLNKNEEFGVLNVPPAVLNSNPSGVLSLTGGKTSTNQTNKAVAEVATKLSRKLALPLMQYCFKSSFHSCYNGADVSLHMLRYTIGRGCRVLDFEVFNVESVAQVGFSYGAQGKGLVPKNEADAKVTLDAALSTVIQSAFSHSTSPNPGDPLFVHLRISADPSDLAFLSTIARTVEANLKGRLFPTPISVDTTTIGDAMEKVVLMINVTSSPNYTNSDLAKYVNMETGTSSVVFTPAATLLTKQATNPHAKGDGLESTVTRLILSTPDTTYLSGWMTSPDYESALLKPYGVQMHMAPFYKNDTALKAYEALFSTAGAAIVPIASVL